MIKGVFRLDDYDWEVVYMLAVESDDIDEVLDVMYDVGCSDKVLYDVENMILGRCCDVGYSWTSRKERKSLITISRASSLMEFINTFAHEIDHVEKHIAKALRFDPYSERASRLVGDMVGRLFNDIINKLLCL